MSKHRGLRKGQRSSFRQHYRNWVFRVRTSAKEDTINTLKSVQGQFDQAGFKVEREGIKRVIGELESNFGWLKVEGGGFKDIMVSKEEAEVLDDVSAALGKNFYVQRLHNK